MRDRIAGESLGNAPSTSSRRSAKQTQPVTPISLHPAPERTDTDGRMPSSSVRSGGLPWHDETACAACRPNAVLVERTERGIVSAVEHERIARRLAEFLEEFPPHGTLRTTRDLHSAAPNELSVVDVSPHRPEAAS